MTESKRLPKGVTRLPSGALYARYRADGRQHGQVFPKGTGNRALEAFLREQKVKAAAGTHVAVSAGRGTFGEYAAGRMEAWRAHKPSTKAQVEYHMRRNILPAFGAMTLGSVRPHHVEQWVSEKSLSLAPSTLHVSFCWLRKVFRDAVAQRLIPSSPCDRIELPRKPKREVRPLSLDQIDALTSAMPDRLAAIVTVAAWSGLRSGEVLGLRRHRLDLLGQRGTDGVRRAPSIRVAEQLQYLSGPPQLVPPKTEKSVRRVPIPTVLVGALAAHLAAYPADPEGFVFTGRTGQPLRRPSLNEAWNRAVKVAGLEGVHFHDLRHTYASLLIEAGESVKVVSARLGHASAVETLETYAHLWPDSDEHTVAVLDAAHARFVSQMSHERAL